jgi:hypothetical protein
LEPLGSPATLTTTPARLGRLRSIFLAKTLTELLVHHPQGLRRSRDAKTWCSPNAEPYGIGLIRAHEVVHVSTLDEPLIW